MAPNRPESAIAGQVLSFTPQRFDTPRIVTPEIWASWGAMEMTARLAESLGASVVQATPEHPAPECLYRLNAPPDYPKRVLEAETRIGEKYDFVPSTPWKDSDERELRRGLTKGESFVLAHRHFDGGQGKYVIDDGWQLDRFLAFLDEHPELGLDEAFAVRPLIDTILSFLGFKPHAPINCYNSEYAGKTNDHYKGIWGHSMGGMIAAHAVSKHPGLFKAFCGCQLSTGNMPNSQGPEIASWREHGGAHMDTEKFGRIWLPEDYFLDRLKFNSKEAARHIHIPTLFIAGLQDQLVGHEDVKQIYESANQPKQYLEFPTDHFYKREPEMTKKINDVTVEFFRKNILLR